MKRIRIRLRRSPIGAKPKLRKTVTALGLRRLNASVVLEATPAVQGMVRTVAHLLEVNEVEGTAKTTVAGGRKPSPSKAQGRKAPASKAPVAKAPAAKAPPSKASAAKPKE